LIEIRHEQPGDVAAIRDVTVSAFGQAEEADIVDALRANGAVSLSLVATIGGRVVGHILYSPVSVGDIAGAGLGPIAVAPEHQRHGIGSQLIETGNQKLREAGCPFIVVLGHPGYYPRFGFKRASIYGLSCEWEVPDDAFMALILNPENAHDLSGPAKYRPEFSPT
jgi:putative acetyltransferase